MAKELITDKEMSPQHYDILLAPTVASEPVLQILFLRDSRNCC